MKSINTQLNENEKKKDNKLCVYATRLVCTPEILYIPIFSIT